MLHVEALEGRTLPSAAYDIGGGLLFVRGDNQGNALLVSADPAGGIHVSERGVEIPVYGLAPTVQNTALVAVQAGTGAANVLAADPSLGQLAVFLDGSRGGDTLFAHAQDAAVTEQAGSDATLHQTLTGQAAVAVSPADEGPNSLAVDALCAQFGVQGPAPITRAQEAQNAVAETLWMERLFTLYGV